MSKNAITFQKYSRNNITNQAEAWGDYADLSMQQMLDTSRWCNHQPENPAMFTRFVSAKGLKALVDDGVCMLEESGATLPHNLIRTQMSSSVGKVGRFGRNLPFKEAEEEIERYARFGGWLKAANGLPALRKVIIKTQSWKGVNSSKTTVDLWSLFEKFNNPGALDKLLRGVKRRADRVLSAYAGQPTISWSAVGMAVMVNAKPQKASIIAVSAFLAGGYARSFREARDFLVEYHKCSIVDTSDGVDGKRAVEPYFSKMGVAIFKIAVPVVTRRGYRVGTRFEKLVKSAYGRTYHSSNWTDGKDLIREASAAWKRQDELAAEAADFIAFLKGDQGVCPLVYLDDSYRSGNCQSGTESWLRSHGWADREFIPAVWLIPYLDEGLVRNVATRVYLDWQHVQLMAA